MRETPHYWRGIPILPEGKSSNSAKIVLSPKRTAKEAPLQTILVANPKGGSGKTTLATNIAGWIAGKRQRVVLADSDPQRSSMQWLRGVARLSCGRRPAVARAVLPSSWPAAWKQEATGGSLYSFSTTQRLFAKSCPSSPSESALSSSWTMRRAAPRSLRSSYTLQQRSH